MKAIIFDLDGVLADTNAIHGMIESEIVARYGIKISPEEISKKYAGRPTTEWFKELLPKGTDVESLIKEKQDKYVKTVEKAKTINGAKQLVERTKQEFKVAIGTGAHEREAKATIKATGIKIPTVIDADKVEKGKPNPDIFLKAAEELGVEAKECLVIEDGRAGMQAAKKAGMKSIGLVSKEDKENYEYYPANILVTSLNDITISLIKKLK